MSSWICISLISILENTNDQENLFFTDETRIYVFQLIVVILNICCKLNILK
jgi:hypothetical protein